MDEVGVAGDVDFHLIPFDFVAYFKAKMLENPADVLDAEVPLEIVEDDEVVNSGVAVLEKSRKHALLDADIHLQAH